MTDNKNEIIREHYRDLAKKSFAAIKRKYKGRKALKKFYSDKAKLRWKAVDNC